MHATDVSPSDTTLYQYHSARSPADVSCRQAIVLAGIFEFLGALLLGTHVTKAIRETIVNVSPSPKQRWTDDGSIRCVHVYTDALVYSRLL